MITKTEPTGQTTAGTSVACQYTREARVDCRSRIVMIGGDLSERILFLGRRGTHMVRLLVSTAGKTAWCRHIGLALGACLLFGLPLQQAWAAKRVALLIGNAQYSVGRLTNPPQDVREIEAALKAVGFGEVETVFDADQKAMKRAIRDFGRKAEGAEIAFLYYSGHGTQANGENYLIPVGASIDKEADYEIEAVSANAVMRQIANARPKATIVVLDACRDNPVALSRSGTKGLSRMDAPTGTMIAFSTAPNTTASDEGYYAKVLARQIRTPGLEVLDVFRNTTSEVMRLSGGRQEPRVSEVSLSERVYFLPRQVASLAPLPSTNGANFGDLEQSRQEEASQAQWVGWLNRMKADFKKAQAFSGSAQLELQAWDRFIAAYPEDDPYSNEDDAMKVQARSRRSAVAQSQTTAWTAVSSGRTAVAFARFGGDAGMSQLVGQVIAQDLERGGWFKLLDSGGLQIDDAAKPDLSVWKGRQADYLVTGSVKPLGNDRFDIRFRVWNVTSGEDVGGQSLVVAQQDTRLAAHRVAERIQQQLVGVPGAYALRLARVGASGDRYTLNVADSDGANPQTALESPKLVGLPTWLGGQKVLSYVSYEYGAPVVVVQNVTSGRRRVSEQSNAILAACQNELDKLPGLAEGARDRWLRDDWAKLASKDCVAAMTQQPFESVLASSAPATAPTAASGATVSVTLDGKTFMALPDEKQVFESSLARLRQADWSGGIKALTDLLTRYPNTGYRESVLYWLGNAQYGAYDFKAAIASFRQLLSIAPEHKRAPDAMLSIANCYTEMRDPANARKVLAELVKAYPDTEAAQAARERLQVKVRHGAPLARAESS